jgi:hypothetical protein
MLGRAGVDQGVDPPCQLEPERVHIFGRGVIVSIGGVGGRRRALTEETIQFPQGSRQRGKRAGGPLQLTRMRGLRRELRDHRLDGEQNAPDRVSAGGARLPCRGPRRTLPRLCWLRLAARPDGTARQSRSPARLAGLAPQGRTLAWSEAAAPRARSAGRPRGTGLGAGSAAAAASSPSAACGRAACRTRCRARRRCPRPAARCS